MKTLKHWTSGDTKTFYAQSGAEKPNTAETPGEDLRTKKLKEMAKERAGNNAEMLKNDMPILSGKEYAEKKEITLKKPLSQEKFDKAWKQIQTTQKKENFKGTQIPENLKDKIWDYVQHTFETDGLEGTELTTALNEKIEEEAIFFKMEALDTPPTKDSPTFPGGHKTEGDYIDWLAKGAPELTDDKELNKKKLNDTSDDIDPELLAYLRATNFNGLGQKNDQGQIDIPGLEKEYKSVLGQLKKLNIQNFDTLRSNIGKLQNKDGTINPAEAAKTFNISPDQLPKSGTEARNGVNTLWDLIRAIIEFTTGKKYSSGDFSGRFAGGEDLGTLPNGGGQATPDFARKALENASGSNKAILAKALESIGVSESGNPGLIRKMHKCAGLNAGPGTPWCASFISWVMKEAGVNGMKSASSKAFLKTGSAVSPNDAQPGDLCIFSRGSGGHIGVFVGWDKNRKPIIIGGNQGNQVSIKPSRQRLIGIRRV